MNTGQTIYEQLQEMLNKCIELGWKSDVRLKVSFIDDDSVVFILAYNESKKSDYMNFHRLFSKDSGIMEFVEWKKKGGLYGLHYSYESMCTLTAHEKVTWFINNTIIPTK